MQSWKRWNLVINPDMDFFFYKKCGLKDEEQIGQGNKVSEMDRIIGIDHAPNQVPRFV